MEDTWFELSLTDQQLLHLDQDASIRFVPNETPGDFYLNYLIWDKSNWPSSGVATVVDTTVVGGAYSIDEAQLRIQVTETPDSLIGQIIDLIHEPTKFLRVRQSALKLVLRLLLKILMQQTT